jgi:hypothetical protein
MDSDLSKKVISRNLVKYFNSDYDSTFFSCKDLFFVSLPMFESKQNLIKCLEPEYQFNEETEVLAFEYLSTILDNFNVLNENFETSVLGLSFNELNLAYLVQLRKSVLCGIESCIQFKSNLRNVHGKFIHYKFRDSFTKELMGKNKHIEMLYQNNLRNCMSLMDDFGLQIVYEKALKVDIFLDEYLI